MDRHTYEHAMAMVDTLDQAADDLDHFLQTLRRKARFHPALSPDMLAFETSVRRLAGRTLDPLLSKWRERVRHIEDGIAGEALRLAPEFQRRVEQLRDEFEEGEQP